MLNFKIKPLTLAIMESLDGHFFDDLLDPRQFVKLLDDPLKVAKFAFLCGTFETTPKPSKIAFFESLQPTDYPELRLKVLTAYRDFFPRPVPAIITTELEELTQTAAAYRQEAGAN